MTVAVTAGTVLLNSVVASVAGGNVTITTAHATVNRIDAIVSDGSGNLSALAGAIVENGTIEPPDTTGYVLLEYVTVLNQADPNYTGTITASAITNGIAGRYIVLPEPAQTFAYTFVSGAQSNADPGAGKLGFDAATNASIAHLYANYVSATTGTSIKTWLQGGASGTPVVPWYLRLWSRESPQFWWLGSVSSFTDHSTYCDLAITWIASSAGTSSPPLTTDALDTVLEFDGAVPSSAVSSVFGRTGAVVAVAGDYHGNFVKRTIYTSGSSATHTWQSSTTQARVEGVGGGGGGGGATVATAQSVSAAGAGGGGGGTFEKFVTGLTGGGTATYTVGGAGSGGADGTHNGTNGGNTSITIGATTYTANGGAFGAPMGSGSAGTLVAGGAGGTATNGDTNETGQDGGNGLRFGAAQATSGDGGCTQQGQGGRGSAKMAAAANAATNGNNAYSYGAGGAGGVCVNNGTAGGTTASGGNGTAGVIIIDEYT